jgi:hypothetical protein
VGTVVIILVVVAAVAGYFWWRAQQQKAAQQAASARPAPPVDPLANWTSSGGDEQFYKLKPGDLVKTDNGDFLVRGTIAYSDGGYAWSEHLLDDAMGNKRWLSVENDEGLEISAWQRIPEVDVENGSAGDRSVVARGVAYKLVERGNAKYNAVGTTGTAPVGTSEYVDYEAADGSLLSYERYDDGAWEVGLGRKVLPSELEVFPGGAV